MLRLLPAIIGMIYLYGAILGLLMLAWRYLFGAGLPSWTWWQYLLAPIGVGAAAIVLEGIGALITKGDKVEDPLFKRALRATALFLVLLFVAVAPMLLKESSA